MANEYIGKNEVDGSIPSVSALIKQILYKMEKSSSREIIRPRIQEPVLISIDPKTVKSADYDKREECLILTFETPTIILRDFRPHVCRAFKGVFDSPEFLEIFNTRAWLKLFDQDRGNREIRLGYLRPDQNTYGIKQFGAGEKVHGMRLAWSNMLDQGGNFLYLSRESK